MTEKMSIPISALIDVVFLLIMFFVATATMAESGLDAKVNLAEAKSMKALKLQSLSRFPISLRSDGSLLYLNQETELGALKQELKRHLIHYGNKAEVQIRADKDCQLDKLDKVMDAFSSVGARNMKIISKTK